MDKFWSHFRFNKQERSGIFFLLLLIVILVFALYLYRKRFVRSPFATVVVDTVEQARVDSLISIKKKEKISNTYPFNPNYISDYKGYMLGMSIDEIDRLHQFRKTGSFVNSASEFQKVTLVSDSLLSVLAPNFKFPEWVTNKSSSHASKNKTKGNNQIKDINSATQEDLKMIRGIGETLAARILKFRDRLGGFRHLDLLYDVYGLDSTVVKEIRKGFQIQSKHQDPVLNLNEASEEEMSDFVYFGKSKARKIAAYRYAKGKIDSLEDLFNNIGIPINKIDRIALYLSL